MACYRCTEYCNVGEEIMGSYNISSHGDLGATHDSLVNADLPQYAHHAYSPTQFEAVSDIKYSRTDIGYDNSLREIKRALDGAPVEAYIPRGFAVEDSGSAVPKTSENAVVTKHQEVIEPEIIKKPSKEILKEIAKAQKEVAGKEVVISELLFEEIILRRIRKREVRIKEKD